jgi:hypothetical protein
MCQHIQFLLVGMGCLFAAGEGPNGDSPDGRCDLSPVAELTF